MFRIALPKETECELKLARICRNQAGWFAEALKLRLSRSIITTANSVSTRAFAKSRIPKLSEKGARVNGDDTSEPQSGEQANSAARANSDSTILPDAGDDISGHFDGQRTVLFNEMAGGGTEVIIEHEGQRYRLRATRNGRLLLNK